MRSLTALLSGILLGVLLAGPAAAGVLSGTCRVANQPAATLLVPYFEVDLSDPQGATTLLSVNNASAKPALARMVVWTDWGVPTLAFDIYLTGYDMQTLNLRDLFSGTLPRTGPAVSPTGALSLVTGDFPGCGSATGPHVVPTQDLPALTAADRDTLRAAHTGRSVGTQPARCLGSARPEQSLAVGYITIDSVNRCTPFTVGTSANTPADSKYFATGGTGLASNSNVLWGDVIYVDRKNVRADSETMVHIVADDGALGAGDYTFYGRYVDFDARDGRAPLSSLYYARYIDDDAFFGQTDLVVWRDNRVKDVTGADCAKGPSWAPLGEFQLLAFDEQENPTLIQDSNAFPLTTQRTRVGGDAIPTPNPYGWLMIDLWHHDGQHAQGWVGIRMSSQGRYSVGHEALRVDDLCNFGL
ncbi:MAG TPA: hypothetical protein VH988_28895 [Thermoanaerobaculia bacterium]|jgi:hypothetical protein|nr:hypothetical protein [Thermoanaerobaculia bacterium]